MLRTRTGLEASPESPPEDYDNHNDDDDGDDGGGDDNDGDDNGGDDDDDDVDDDDRDGNRGLLHIHIGLEAFPKLLPEDNDFKYDDANFNDYDIFDYDDDEMKGCSRIAA